MRAAERTVFFKSPADAFVIGERRLEAVGRGVAHEHHVIAAGEQITVLVERDEVRGADRRQVQTD